VVRHGRLYAVVCPGRKSGGTGRGKADLVGGGLLGVRSYLLADLRGEILAAGQDVRSCIQEAFFVRHTRRQTC